MSQLSRIIAVLFRVLCLLALVTMTPAEFDAFLCRDIDKWAQVAKFAGAVVQWPARIKLHGEVSAPWRCCFFANPDGAQRHPDRRRDK
jgi:hypothetical protein